MGIVTLLVYYDRVQRSKLRSFKSSKVNSSAVLNLLLYFQDTTSAIDPCLWCLRSCGGLHQKVVAQLLLVQSSTLLLAITS